MDLCAVSQIKVDWQKSHADFIIQLQKLRNFSRFRKKTVTIKVYDKCLFFLNFLNETIIREIWKHIYAARTSK